LLPIIRYDRNSFRKKRLIGYARVSTYGQTLDSQLEQLRAAGCSSRNIYGEKVTGARPDRRELLRMLEKLSSSDLVTVTRIDRLARSTFDLFGIVKRIVDAKAQFRSLAEPWADTGTSTGRLMLAVLGGLADVERDLIRTRTAEGRSRAKAQGKPMGRPPYSQPGATERGHQTPRAGRDAARIRAQLQCRDIDHPAGDTGRMTGDQGGEISLRLQWAFAPLVRIVLSGVLGDACRKTGRTPLALRVFASRPKNPSQFAPWQGRALPEWGFSPRAV
jgi:DNA invertase Pin-like site-specific DNA recombinase